MNRRSAVTTIAIVTAALLFNPLTLQLVTGHSFSNFRVDGLSMSPTLDHGDIYVVDRLTLRYFRSPKRGDIVVLRDPRQAGKDLVKRVVGLPGETLEIVDGRVYINGYRLEEPYITAAWGGTLPRVTVPEGEFFVMGDNRSNSLDSRSPSVGLIPRQLITGTLLFSYLPMAEHPRGFAVVLAAGALLLLLAAAVIAATRIVATRRGRSAWWAVLSLPLGGAGLLVVYFFVRPRRTGWPKVARETKPH